MAIRFFCPLGHRLVVPDDRAGKKGRCPICHQKVYIPVADPTPSGRPKRPPKIKADSWESQLEKVIEEELGLKHEPPPPPPPPPPSPPKPTNYARTPLQRRRMPPGSSGRPVRRSPQPAATRQVRPWLVVTSDSDLARAWRCDPGKVHGAAWLAAVIVLLATVQSAPAWSHWRLADAPPWALVLWLLAAVQIAYALWLATVPHFVALSVGSTLFTLVVAVYAMGLTIAATPAGRVGLFGMADVRRTALGWCVAGVLLAGLLTYACAAYGARWRRHDAAWRRVRTAPLAAS